MEVKEGPKDRKDVKGNEANAKKKFSRRDTLKAGLALLGGALLSRCSSEYRAINDGGTGDASGLDGTVDASGLDGSTSLDASVFDAMVPDANVPDASVDPDAAQIECVSEEGNVSWYPMSPNQTVTVGGYNIMYLSMSQDLQEITVDVTCAADNSTVATGVTVQRSQTETLQMGDGYFMSITFLSGTPQNINLSASVAPTI